MIHPTHTFLRTKISDLRDIAAMKVAAIASRGTKRDFIDLYYILKMPQRMEDILTAYEKKFGSLMPTLPHILKSLSYFVDAERDKMPKMIIETKWETVREFFEKESMGLGEKFFGQ